MYAPEKGVKYTVQNQYHCLEFPRKDSIELSLVYCGKDSCTPGYTFGPAKRTEYLLHYVIDGCGQFTANGKTWNLKKNDAFLIFPNETTVYSADAESPWSYIWIAFNGIKAYEYLQYAGFSIKNRVGHFECEKKLVQCIDHILSAHELTYSNQLNRQIQLLTFLSTLIQERENNTTELLSRADYSQQSYVTFTMNYIEQNYQMNITINDICSKLGITRSYLTKLFKNVLHTSPYDYLLNVRIDKAISLLKYTTLPIKEVAALVGYQDPLVFSKTFKKKTGISPISYRNSANTLIRSSIRDD